jgi:hypothetical protein
VCTCISIIVQTSEQFLVNFVLKIQFSPFKQNPVHWQVSSDGTRMIGHMVLRKNLDGEDILGLKVVGGRKLPNGTNGALIEKVKRGSIADNEGLIKPGNCKKHTQKKNH